MSPSLEILRAHDCGHTDRQFNIKIPVYSRRKAAAALVADRGRSNTGLPNIEGVSAGNLMRIGPRILIPGAVVVGLLCSLPQIARATGAEPAKEPPVDPAPCVAAATANDDDKIIAACGALGDNEKTATADRITALIARGGALSRQEQIDRASGAYDTVPPLPPPLSDIYIPPREPRL